MENINLKVIKSYLSIQKGFEWKDIPPLAIVTGVNGAGKTHLLSILSNEDSIVITTSDGVGVDFVLSSQIRRDLSIEGLIAYKNDVTQRIVKNKELDDNITRYRNTISSINNNIVVASDKISLQKLSNDKRNYNTWLNKALREKKTLNVYAYEKELENILIKTGKAEIDGITDSEIREYANPYFNTLTEIQDFEKFIKQEEVIRNELYVKLAKESREHEIAGIRNQERAFEKINRLFKKYGFGYFDMLDPFPADKSRNGEILFKGLNGELVQYSSLSSGEQMIVKFIIWAMATDIRGNRINTMLLDEPDAHLHPSMCKMMVDIFHEISKPKELGGSDIRVIITTHSPSTVAFAPSGSLFVMGKDENNNRKITQTSTEEAVRVLSDGIFTYEKAINKFTLIANSNKNNILFVEGKTDVLHLNRANELLGYNLPFEVIDMHDAGSLSNFIKSTPSKLFPGKKLIALFDADGEGYKSYGSITGDSRTIPQAKIITAVQCENNSFAMTLVAPDYLNKYCPIEFLYPLEYLRRHNMLEKRSFQEYQSLYKACSREEADNLNEEYDRETGLKPFKTNDSNKDTFSHICSLETESQIFDNFKPTLEVIKQIIEYK